MKTIAKFSDQAASPLLPAAQAGGRFAPGRTRSAARCSRELTAEERHLEHETSRCVASVATPSTPVFPARPTKLVTDLAEIRRWQSKCGQWRVIFRRSHYGLPDVWLVLKLRTVDGQTGWDIRSRHRTKQAAFRAVTRPATPAKNRAWGSGRGEHQIAGVELRAASAIPLSTFHCSRSTVPGHGSAVFTKTSAGDPT